MLNVTPSGLCSITDKGCSVISVVDISAFLGWSSVIAFTVITSYSSLFFLFCPYDKIRLKLLLLVDAES
jgi:hypothetical protein